MTDGLFMLCEVVIEFFGSSERSLGQEFCDAVCLDSSWYLNSNMKFEDENEHKYIQAFEQDQHDVEMPW